ncbi:MAG: hypothetical protein ACRDF4_03490, partial [Rhabdochlamydiaceae bacterium]
ETLPYTQLRVRDMENRYSLEYVVESSIPARIQTDLDVIGRICEEEGGTKAAESDKEYIQNLPALAELRSEKFVRAPRFLVAFISGRKEFSQIYAEIKGFLSKQFSSRRLGQLGASMNAGFQPNMRNSIYCSINLNFDNTSEECRSEILSLGKQAYEMLVQMGCCPEPHQGFGAEVISRSWSKEYGETIVGLKRLFDPNMILNVGVWGL